MKLLIPMGFIDTDLFITNSYLMDLRIAKNDIIDNSSMITTANQTVQTSLPNTIDLNRNDRIGILTKHSRSFMFIILIMWFSISVCILTSKLYMYYRFKRRLRYHRLKAQGWVRLIYDDCLKLFRKNMTEPSLYILSSDLGYCIPFSTFSFSEGGYCIYIPSNMIEQKSKSSFDLKLVIVHELCHCSYHDNLINLLRFTALILFHWHPLRLLADRFCFSFQEIVTDLSVIEKLNISKKQYIGVLLARFMDVEKKRNVPHVLCTPFLEGDITVVKRLFFIKRYNNKNKDTLYNKLVEHILCLSAVLIVLFSCNITIFLDSVSLNESCANYSFNSKEYSSSDITYNKGCLPRFYKDRLFVIYPTGEISSIKYDTHNKISYLEYQDNLIDTGDDRYYNRILDAIFYKQNAYLLRDIMGDDDNYIKQQLLVFNIYEDFRFNLVKIVDLKDKISKLDYLNEHLVLYGRSNRTDETITILYDITTPTNPEFAETIFCERLKDEKLHRNIDDYFIRLTKDKVVLYNDNYKHTLKTMNEPIGYVRYGDNRLIIISKSTENWNFSYNIQLFQRSMNMELELIDICYFTDEIKDNSEITDIFIHDDFLYLTGPNFGSSIWRINHPKIELMAYKNNGLSSSAKSDDHLYFLNPYLSIFSKSPLSKTS